MADMSTGHVLGVDPGFAHDPTGWVLVKTEIPRVVVRDGKVLDVVTGEPVVIHEGMTPAEHAQPRFEVVDAQRRRGLTFEQTAREARAVAQDIDGRIVVACDATGTDIGTERPHLGIADEDASTRDPGAGLSNPPCAPTEYQTPI